MPHQSGPGNIITGPGGEVVGRPSEVPTGIASHVSFLVREVKGIKEAMKRKVAACEQEKKERNKEEGDSQPYGPSPWALGILDFAYPKPKNARRGGPGDPSGTTGQGGSF